MKAEKQDKINGIITLLSEKLGVAKDSPKPLHKAVAKAVKDLVDKVAKAEKKKAQDQKKAVIKEIKQQEKAAKKAKFKLAVETALKKVASADAPAKAPAAK